MVDLNPWFVVLGEPPTTSVAQWQVAAGGERSLAIFSSQQRALQYAVEFCAPPVRTLQLEQHGLIQLLAECYQQGTRYAALDPDGSSSRQMFVLRDVLRAARTFLKNAKSTSYL